MRAANGPSHKKKETQNDQRHIHQAVAQEQHVENATRIFPEELYEFT